MSRLIGTLFLLAVSCSIFAQEHLEKASPYKIGKPIWVMRVYAGDIFFYKKPAQRGALDPAGITQDDKLERHTWQVRPSSIKSTMQLMGKFVEWSAVAKKNGVRNYEKQIGKTEFPDEKTFNFIVREGASTLSIGPLVMDEFDAATVLSLLASIPELTATTGKAKPVDPRDALFK